MSSFFFMRDYSEFMQKRRHGRFNAGLEGEESVIRLKKINISGNIAAVIIEGERDFYDSVAMKNNDKSILKYFKMLEKNFELRACYEASCNGYEFQRKMKNWNFHCYVIAPSLIPKKPGDKRKNDYRDARNLAQLYTNGQLTVVHPPSEEQESIRNFIRCRLNLKESS